MCVCIYYSSLRDKVTLQGPASLLVSKTRSPQGDHLNAKVSIEVSSCWTENIISSGLLSELRTNLFFKIKPIRSLKNSLTQKKATVCLIKCFADCAVLQVGFFRIILHL